MMVISNSFLGRFYFVAVRFSQVILINNKTNLSPSCNIQNQAHRRPLSPVVINNDHNYYLYPNPRPLPTGLGCLHSPVLYSRYHTSCIQTVPPATTSIITILATIASLHFDKRRRMVIAVVGCGRMVVPRKRAVSSSSSIMIRFWYDIILVAGFIIVGLYVCLWNKMCLCECNNVFVRFLVVMIDVFAFLVRVVLHFYVNIHLTGV